jgi:hypothetical protein
MTKKALLCLPGILLLGAVLAEAPPVSAETDVPIKINSRKEVLEVLPAKEKILGNDLINTRSVDGAVSFPRFHNFMVRDKGKKCYMELNVSLRHFLSLEEKLRLDAKNSPLKAKITYDDTHLLIATEAEFAGKPLAMAKQTEDARLHRIQDETLQFFFSPENNMSKIHFLTNAAGVSFSSAGAGVVTRDNDSSKQRSLPHAKEISYSNGVWKTLFAAPLRDLGLSSGAGSVMGFQLAQCYNKRDGSKYEAPVLWSPTDNISNPLGFGVLVFNKKPFGPGDIRIKEISGTGKSGGETNLRIRMSGKNFPRGEYKIKTMLVSDYSSVKTEEQINLAPEETEFVVRITAKNLGSDNSHTVYALACNKDGDIKADAVTFEITPSFKDMFGENIFCPTPKKVKWENGVFTAGNAAGIILPPDAAERMMATAGMLKDKLLGFAGAAPPVVKSGFPKNNSISLKISREAVFDGVKTALRPEGYCLDVTPGGAVITGADEAGLYYACVTFLQLVKMPMKITAGAPVKCVRILDWPDVPNRMVRIDHPFAARNSGYKEPPRIEMLMDWIERFVAENKFNRLFLDISPLIKFERQPEFCGPERVFTLDDLRRLGEFCRRHFIEVIPAFEVGGHADWWLLPYHPELTEKGYPMQADVTHPDHNRIVFNCMLDVIEAMKARHLSPKTDEWWEMGSSAPDELLRGGKNRAQAFLDFHVGLNNWLREKNVRMHIYEDMLDPGAHGRRYDAHKVIDKFPKDIIISQWGSKEPDITAVYFLDRGFEVWGNATGYWVYKDKSVKSRVSGMGSSTYNMGSDWKLYRKDLWFSMYEIFMGADISWNLLDNAPNAVNETASGRLPAIRELYALRPNPAASPNVTPLNIQKSMNSCFPGFPPPEAKGPGLRDAGNIPMLLSNGALNCVIPDKDGGMSLPCGRNCSSLIFLHTFVPDEVAKLSVASAPYGLVTGYYQAHYADGGVEKLPLRLFWNIGVADANPLFRSTNDNRYIMTLKTAEGHSFLYQWEWVNPAPEKKIEKITYISSDDLPFKAKTFLFAVSCRDVKEGR